MGASCSDLACCVDSATAGDGDDAKYFSSVAATRRSNHTDAADSKARTTATTSPASFSPAGDLADRSGEARRATENSATSSGTSNGGRGPQAAAGKGPRGAAGRSGTSLNFIDTDAQGTSPTLADPSAARLRRRSTAAAAGGGSDSRRQSMLAVDPEDDEGAGAFLDPDVPADEASANAANVGGYMILSGGVPIVVSL
jgi:hypothetical protein